MEESRQKIRKQSIKDKIEVLNYKLKNEKYKQTFKDDDVKFTKKDKGFDVKDVDDASKVSETTKKRWQRDIKKLEQDLYEHDMSGKDGWEILDSKDVKVTKTKPYSEEQAREETGEYFKNEATSKVVPGLAKDEDELVEKILSAKEETFSSEQLQNIRNCDAGDILDASEEDGIEGMKKRAQDLAKKYKKGWKYITDNIESGEPQEAPIVIRDKKGRLHLMAGNTRIMSNTAYGKKIPLKVIEYDDEFETKYYSREKAEGISEVFSINEARFDKKLLLKMRDDGDKVFKNIDKFIKDFVKKLNSSSIKPNASVRKITSKNIKKGSNNPRVQITIDCKDIGAGSRSVVFDEVNDFKGKFKTKFNNSNKFSSAGHIETTIDDILVMFEFKGGKKSSGEASMTTDQKEAMVGVWFQSKWSKPITKANASEAVNQIIGEIPSMKGESSSIKSGLVKYLKGLPTDDAKAPVLNALNDTLASGLTIKNKYKSWTWERNKIFDNIRSEASSIVGMTADKWNPGDVYLMKSNKSSAAISKAKSVKSTSINQKIGHINNLFVSSWGGTDGSFVSVSLKQASAQAGKGKQYLKKFDGTASDFDYNLTSEEQKLKNEEPEVLLSALIPQIEDWRSSISSKLSGGGIKYTYSPESTSELEDLNKANFLYQKYASLKMFAYMADKLKTDNGVFMDAAAFSLSLTGYNPTFFKVKGNKSGTASSAEKYESGGGITLKDNKIDITDTNTNAGITFKFKAENNDLGTGDLVMNIRFNGTTQATLEMLSASWS